MSDSNILVTGASGTLGSAVVRRLSAAGVRHAGAGRGAKPPAMTEWCRIDLATGAGLEAALAGRSAVVHCATNVAKPDEDLAALQRLIGLAGRRIHIVFIGIAGIDAAARHLSYYRVKQQCEAALRAGEAPFSIVRPTQFHEFVDFVFGKMLHGPLFFLPPMTLQPLDVNFAAGLVAQVAAGEAGQLVEIAGPERLGPGFMADLWLHARNRRPLRIPLPAIGPLAAMASILPSDAMTGGISFREWTARHGQDPAS